MAPGPTASPRPEVIGLIAGNGAFPRLFAQAARAAGVAVRAVGMRGETEPELAAEVDEMVWVQVGQLGHMVRALRRFGVRQAAMAGGVHKARLFDGLRPDLRGLKVLARCLVRRDDGLLRAIAREFEREGIAIVDSTLFMPEAMGPAGVLTRLSPTPQAWHDLRYGLGVAREIGRLDVGQTVVVHEGAVVALEALEGTDACIARAGALLRGRGGVAVKVAKPAQDMRFDVPAVGEATVATLVAAGIMVLGIEAGRTLLLAPQRVLEAADRLGLVVVGLTAEEGCVPASLS